MAVAGIDMGSQSTKLVIMESNRILAAVTLKTGESGESEAFRALEEALLQAQLKEEDIKNVVSTGVGKMNVPFARKQRSIVSCLARGAFFLFPGTRTVLDAGAESSTAIRVSEDGLAEDSVGNNLCAAGTGMFLETMSWILRIPLAELGPESLKATNAETISSRCTVFAESEVISLVHGDPPVPAANILAGIHASMADRLFGMVQRVGAQHDIVMTGGVSRDSGIIRAMEARLGKKVLVPEDPQVVGALGAALIAQQDSSSREGTTC